MAEYEGLDEATLQHKLEAATSYDERSALRHALRQLKKERGEQVGSARKGQSGYNRFVATKPVGKSSAKNYVHLDGSAERTAAAATSPASPTCPPAVSAKKKDVFDTRTSRSHSPSPSPLTQDTEASNKGDPCSPVSPDRDGDTVGVMPARTISPPPPLSPGSAPCGGGKLPHSEESENERKSTCSDPHEEERVRRKMEEEEKVRRKVEERERRKMVEEEEVRRKVEEERVRRKMEEEEKVRRKVEEEEVRKKVEEERVRRKMEEEEEERVRKMEEKVRMMEEERVRRKMEEIDLKGESDIMDGVKKMGRDTGEDEGEVEEAHSKGESAAELKKDQLQPLEEADVAAVVAGKTQQSPLQREPSGHTPLQREPSDHTPSQKEPSGHTPLQKEPSGGFQGVRLSKAPSAPKNSKDDQRKDASRDHASKDTKFDFGVKLKQRPKSPPPPDKKTESWRDMKTSGGEGGVGGASSPRTRAHTVAARPQKNAPSGGGSPPTSSGGPRTLRDFQELAAKANKGKKAEESKPATPLDNTVLYSYLNVYVTKELNLPSTGASLYDVCSNSLNLCKLINKSVPNTVDLRALTPITSSTNKHACDEAEQDNMTLVTESARAIGCHITDSTGAKILHRDPETICTLLVDLIRARVVNMPGMDEEPASVFQDMRALFEKLGVKVEHPSTDAVDSPAPSAAQDQKGTSKGSWRDYHLRGEEPEAPPPQPPKTWREPPPMVASGDSQKVPEDGVTYEERVAQCKAARSAGQGGSGIDSEPQKNDQKDSESSKGPEAATYEERAAMRRAEREKRMKEREALATPK